jgi:hypothetical protein
MDGPTRPFEEDLVRLLLRVRLLQIGWKKDERASLKRRDSSKIALIECQDPAGAMAECQYGYRKIGKPEIECCEAIMHGKC